MPVFEQIFIGEEYSCLCDLKDTLLILDLGANVGFSSAYFLSHVNEALPNLTIVIASDFGN